MPTATADSTRTTEDAVAEIVAASDRLAERMTTEYTPIWDVSDFLLDSAAALSADPLAVAEVHELLKDLAPSEQRSVVRTSEVAEMVASVRRIAGVPEQTTAQVG